MSCDSAQFHCSEKQASARVYPTLFHTTNFCHRVKLSAPLSSVRDFFCSKEITFRSVTCGVYKSRGTKLEKWEQSQVCSSSHSLHTYFIWWPLRGSLALFREDQRAPHWVIRQLCSFLHCLQPEHPRSHSAPSLPCGVGCRFSLCG